MSLLMGIFYFLFLYWFCEGLRTVVKLVDRETLLKESEEKKKVINQESYDEVTGVSAFHY